MHLAPCCNPCPAPAPAGVRCEPACHRPAHHVAEAEVARVVPGALAEQGALPLKDDPCEPALSGKWPWQLPPTCDEPPPAEPKPWFVSYPSPAEARTGSMLDLLA